VNQIRQNNRESLRLRGIGSRPARELLPRAFAIDTNPDLDYPEVDWVEKLNKQVGDANYSLTSQSHFRRMVVD